MFRKSLDAMAAVRLPDWKYSQSSQQDLNTLEALARLYAEAGDRERTAQTSDQAMAAAKNLLAAEPTSERRQATLANAYFERASAFRTLGDSANAIRIRRAGAQRNRLAARGFNES